MPAKKPGCKFCPGGRSAKNCPYCAYCLLHDHCHCIRCNRCDRRQGPKAMCPRCKSCRTHHAADTYYGREFPLRRCEYIGELTPKPRPTTHLLNRLPRTIGVEVELGSVGRYNVQSAGSETKLLPIRVERDGSVTSGIELVVHHAKGDLLVSGLTELLYKLRERVATVDASCGYHVHVDGSDLKPSHLRRLVILFQLLQPQIFGALVQKQRAANQFCRGLAFTSAEMLGWFALSEADMKEYFHQYLYGMSVKQDMSAGEARTILAELKKRKQHKYENAARRQALNLHSWMMRGTVEFRCKEGTLNTGDFLMWPLWCGWLVEFASQLGDVEVKKWIKDGPPTLVEIAQRAMPKDVGKWVEKKCGK